MLEKILFPRLAPGAAILDLCCGVGTISRLLAERGYRVTGIDNSKEMIRYARQDGGAEFIRADARRFRNPCSFDAAVCTFDSLNHVVETDDLRAVFRNVHESLVAAGAFAFDVNLEEAYRTQWGGTCTIVEADNALFVRGRYDSESRLGRTDVTTFRLGRGWRRFDSVLWQRCYSEKEIRSLLAEAGFSDAKSIDVPRDLGVDGPAGSGRAFFLACRDQ